MARERCALEPSQPVSADMGAETTWLKVVLFFAVGVLEITAPSCLCGVSNQAIVWGLPC